jgi:hypothetical protein
LMVKFRRSCGYFDSNPHVKRCPSWLFDKWYNLDDNSACAIM